MLVALLLLTAAWVALTGEVTFANAFEGAVLSALLLLLVRFRGRPGLRLSKAPKAAGLFLYFLKELLLSNAAVARSILRPVSSLSPGIVAVPLDLTT